MLKTFMYQGISNNRETFQIVIPGSNIPEWFSHRRVGCSLSVDVPAYWNNSRVLGLALCAVFVLHEHHQVDKRYINEFKTFNATHHLVCFLKLNGRELQVYGRQPAFRFSEEFCKYQNINGNLVICQSLSAGSDLALESSPPEQHSLPELHSPSQQCSRQEQQQIDSDLFSSDYDGNFQYSFSDLDSSDDEVTIDPTSEAVTKLMSSVKVGYKELEASMAIERCGINVVRCWWEQTNQRGNLNHLADVQELNADCLKYSISSFGGFDLVIGGSPCNNLAGGNRHHASG